MSCLLPFAWVPVSGEKMFSRPVANCQLLLVVVWSVIHVTAHSLLAYHY